MNYKRLTRNFFCWLLARILIAIGYVNRVKPKYLEDEAIIPIYFHNPNKKLLKKLVTWFKKNNFVFISSSQLTDILNRKIPCPKGAVWLSLDDGWLGNMNRVIPVAIEYDIPISIFISTYAVESGNFWWTILSEINQHLPSEYSNLQSISRIPEKERKRILSDIDNYFTDSAISREVMSKEDIKKITEIPQITIGSHTVTHPFLENCTDDEINYELKESKKLLETWTGKPITTFSYPFGSFDNRLKRLLLENGYELATTVENNFIRIDYDCFLIPRYNLVDDGSFSENLCRAFGILQPIIDRFKKSLTYVNIFSRRNIARQSKPH